jgi:hypothetical protein
MDPARDRNVEMSCYFQGCAAKGTTKEHIPPRSFFPDGEKMQLLTVKSCVAHNNAKSNNDLYALAQICMNASPSNRAREVWETKVVPQLAYNDGRFRDMLAEGSAVQGRGVRYVVNRPRLDEFFTALCCGLVYKSQGSPLPADYRLGHIYHNLQGEADPRLIALEAGIGSFYAGEPLDFMAFGNPDLRNQRIYTAEIHGLSRFRSSITIVHLFFGVFKVTSMLTRTMAGIPDR